ncbi:MAG: hypothetical protein WD800_06550, partial [Dehalococcoidia bacterium]
MQARASRTPRPPAAAVASSPRLEWRVQGASSYPDGCGRGGTQEERMPTPKKVQQVAALADVIGRG